MKKMKKFSALLLTAAMTLSMAACGNSSAGTSTTEAASNASKNTAETQTDTASSEAAESTASNGDLEDFSIVLDWYPNAVHSFIYYCHCADHSDAQSPVHQTHAGSIRGSPPQ